MTNLEAKKEAIKKGYGNYYETFKEEIDENGWIGLSRYGFEEDWCKEEKFDKMTYEIFFEDSFEDEMRFFRPKSLEGIDNNNGWIRIESEDDLPKVQDSFYVCFKNGEIIQRYFIPNNKHSKEDWRNITHWQPIEKPKPPIY